MNVTPISQLTFSEAADRWLEMKRPFISARTVRDYLQYLKVLKAALRDTPMPAITIEHIRAYQRERLKTAGPLRTNSEVQICLRQILREADMWDAIKPKYKPLPLPRLTPGRALTSEEKQRLFQVSRAKPKWFVAFYAAVLSANTTAGPGEIRHVQLGDIDLNERKIHIRRAVKNKHRVRTLDLNDDAFEAVSRLLERARAKGAHLPEHYLLPARCYRSECGPGFDPTRPQQDWHTSWRQICDAAGLHGLRIYDMRHTAITDLYSNPNIPERAILEIAGWSTPAMAARYAHIRSGLKKNALLSLSSGLVANSSGTVDAMPPLPSQQGKPDAPINPRPSGPAPTSTLAIMLGRRGAK